MARISGFLFDTFKLAAPVIVLLLCCCGLPLMLIGPPEKPEIIAPIENPGIKFVASNRDGANNLAGYTISKPVETTIR